MNSRLFERGANSVGLDFLAHPFWDKYLEFEERIDGHAQIFSILNRIIHIPMHQYARYFERFRSMASSRPVAELVLSDTLAQFSSELNMEGGGQSASEQERELRSRIDQFHLDIFTRTQTETTKRWTYEQEIKRPYFHVTDLDDAQLVNWRKYLDFEEGEGDIPRIVFLYERCLVTAAYYEEFWLRFARWMSSISNKDEEVRHIYQRASCLYCPIAQPQIRIHYALFEEQSGRVDIARDIHEAILFAMPGHVDTIVSWANLQRRHIGLDAAVEVYRNHIESPDSGCDNLTKGALVGEWARLLWKGKGRPDEARTVFQKHAGIYIEVRRFWESWLLFEIDLPTAADEKAVAQGAAGAQDERIRAVWRDVRRKSRLGPDTVKELGTLYMRFLMERGGDGTAREYLALDRELA